MSLWIIEPRDPLIVRDGRPFDAAPGARSVSLPFPLPGTLAGAVRTRAVVCARGSFPAGDASTIALAQKIAVRGPLAVEIECDTGAGVRVRLLAPAPADALLLNPLEGAPKDAPPRRKQLAPVQPPAGSWTDNCTNGQAGPVIGLLQPDEKPSKPYNKAPRFWHWNEFLCWLGHPQPETPVDAARLGHAGPVPETRSHVSIDNDSRTNLDGALFQTRGLRFTRLAAAGHTIRMAMAVEVGALPEDLTLCPGVAPLGGERRLMFWRRGEFVTNNGGVEWPECPPDLSGAMAETGACRVLLLTPAAFNAGWQPQPDTGWLLQTRHGVTPRLVAAALGRAQTVSGWNLAYTNPKTDAVGQPKPSRRLAPAGSVYFLQFNADSTPEQRQQWVKEIWFNPVSDEARDRNDGLGLAALGVWSGDVPPMEFGQEEASCA